MIDDQMTKQLAQVAKEGGKVDQRLDPRWDRLSAGTLPPEEEAALRALAETSAEAREAYEAFRPLDAEYRAGIVRMLKAESRKAASATVAATAGDSLRASIAALGGRILAFVRRLPVRIGSPAVRYGGWISATAALVVAAVGLHQMLGPGGALPPLPDYVPELATGVLEMRAEPPAGEAAVAVFVPGSRFELILRPQSEVEGGVHVRLFLVRDGESRPWDVPPEIRPNGVVRVAGEIGREIVIEPGEWTLWALVARPEAWPDEDQLPALLRQPVPRAPDWVLLRTTFTIETRP